MNRPPRRDDVFAIFDKAGWIALAGLAVIFIGGLFR